MSGGLRQAVVRLAHEVPEARRHLVPLLREAGYTEWDHTFVNDHVRVKWNDGAYFIEELPGKPVKRRVRRTHVGMKFTQMQGAPSIYNMSNVTRMVRLTPSTTFDALLDAIKDARLKLLAEAEEQGQPAPKWMWEEAERKPWIDTVSFLEVEPADFKPISAKGKDFVMTSKWTEFSAYSPSSDFQQADPYYHYYGEKSPGAARRLFKILKAAPDALKNVTHSQLTDWLTKAGVGYESHHSVWH